MTLKKVVFMGSSAGGRSYVTEIAPQLNLANACLILYPHVRNREIYAELQRAGLNVEGVVDGTEFTAGVIYEFAHDASICHVKYPVFEGTVTIKTIPGPIRAHDRHQHINPAMIDLSEIYRSHLVGVVLSGMGIDGALGSKRVKENGGKVYVQDETRMGGNPGPFRPYMPYAANKACGSVDFVGTAAELTDQLNLLLSRPL